MTEASDFQQQEWMVWDATQKLVAAFHNVNMPIRFVGGCVRNSILNLPVTDIDLATPAVPEKSMQILQDAGIKAIPTGIAHGTITAVIEGKPFEITTLRRDVACDGRHAEVAFTHEWREDAQRRDFTMNAMYVSPQGELFDYHGGMADALAGRVIFIGDANERIREDALRMLRFFRFYASYGKGEPHSSSLLACTKHRAMVEELSGERIQAEMLKLLSVPVASRSCIHMQRAGLFSHITLEGADASLLTALETLEQRFEFTPDPLRRLALLVRNCNITAIRQVEKLAERWKLSRLHQKQLMTLVQIPPVVDMLEHETDTRRFIRAVSSQHAKDMALLRMAEAREHLPSHPLLLKQALSWRPPLFPIMGQDLLGIGYRQGRMMGEVLDMLERYWEEQDYKPTREKLLARAKEMLI